MTDKEDLKQPEKDCGVKEKLRESFRAVPLGFNCTLTISDFRWIPSDHVSVERSILNLQSKIYNWCVRYCLLAFVTRFFTFCLFLFALLFLSLSGFCQPGAEVGVMGGVGYYQGEYNVGAHFKNTQPYWAGFYRYNLNDRFAIRLNAGFSKIEIERRPLLPNGTETYPEGFSCQVRDFSGLIEFNFRSFMVEKIEKSSWWAPYLFTGAGYFKAGDTQSVSIPMGIGVKFNLYKQLSCGIEWSARKLFTDKVDQVYDPWGTGETNFVYNKDWFFVAGITLSYRFPVEMECHF